MTMLKNAARRQVISSSPAGTSPAACSGSIPYDKRKHSSSLPTISNLMAGPARAQTHHSILQPTEPPLCSVASPGGAPCTGRKPTVCQVGASSRNELAGLGRGRLLCGMTAKTDDQAQNTEFRDFSFPLYPRVL